MTWTSTGSTSGWLALRLTSGICDCGASAASGIVRVAPPACPGRMAPCKGCDNGMYPPAKGCSEHYASDGLKPLLASCDLTGQTRSCERARNKNRERVVLSLSWQKLDLYCTGAE